MTETEWKLRKENAQLKIALAQAQARLCEEMHRSAVAEDQALGAEYVTPPNEG